MSSSDISGDHLKVEPAAAADLVEVARIHEVVMDVDAVRPPRGLLRALRHQLSREQSGSAERGERAEKTAPRRAAAAGKTGNVVVFRSGIVDLLL